MYSSYNIDIYMFYKHNYVVNVYVYYPVNLLPIRMQNRVMLKYYIIHTTTTTTTTTTTIRTRHIIGYTVIWVLHCTRL